MTQNAAQSSCMNLCVLQEMRGIIDHAATLVNWMCTGIVIVVALARTKQSIERRVVSIIYLHEASPWEL